MQASIVHPNIVEIYDIGEFEEDGAAKPFFVMPLLPGVTLDRLIREGSPTLTVERSIGIICQACRGLQAAHDHGLVHRDLKPSNLFVMEDDSVKIIDFGIAHLTGTGAKTTLKGTLSYMAPEQLEMKAPSPLSDIFSLAVVCYQTLTRRLPFHGNSEYEITEAILKHSPAPISEINSSVNDAHQQRHPQSAGQAALAPLSQRQGVLPRRCKRRSTTSRWRFSILKRSSRASSAPRKRSSEGDYDFASEVLFELEAEGHLDTADHPDAAAARPGRAQTRRSGSCSRAPGASSRPASTAWRCARRRKRSNSMPTTPTRLTLKNQIEKERHAQSRSTSGSCWRGSTSTTRPSGRRAQAIDSVLKLKPSDTHALRSSAEVERLERETAQSREDKKKLYEAAMKAWQKGEITASLSKLESLVSLEQDRPDTDGGRGATYQKFYQQVRSEHDSIRNGYDEARTIICGTATSAPPARSATSTWPNIPTTPCSRP